MDKKISVNDKTIHSTLINYRSFGSGIPKFIRKNIDENLYEKIKNKDVTTYLHLDIEEN